jgi:hypothetical protein
MEQCTLFVLSSQYVLLGERVLACFDPQWPNLNFAVAGFDFAGQKAKSTSVATLGAFCVLLTWHLARLSVRPKVFADVSVAGERCE